MITIKWAAIKHKDKVYTGYRHALIMAKIWDEIGGEYISDEEQGFVTSEGLFVSRTEAADIAFKAGQIGSGINSLDSYQIFK